MKRIALSALLISGLVVPAAAQGDFDGVKIEVTQVAGTIHMLQGAGGNIGVSVGEDGVLMIDTQFAPLAEKIRAAVASIGPGGFEFVLNTHAHGDHVGGNEKFGGEAVIMSHTNVRKRVSTEPAPEQGGPPALPRAAWPVITFDESLTVHFNGEEMQVMHYPASHTDGDAVIFFPESNVVHMGDLMFAGRFPFVDVASGGTVEGLLASVNAILEKLNDDVKLIPGHGPLSTKADLVAYRDMIRDTSDLVRGYIKDGKTLEEAKAAGLLDPWNEAWTWNFISTETWLETLFTSLGK